MTTFRPQDANPPAPLPRYHFLDWVRIIAFFLLILFHVGMYYVTWDWHVKSPHASETLEPFMVLSTPWRLSLLFLVSGVASSCMLAKLRPLVFLRKRSWRLLIPLMFGMLVIVPPQSYCEVIEKLGYAGSYADFMGLYLRGYHGFCKDGCLILPTWNHLWFVAYLWVYTVVLALLMLVLGPRFDRLAARLGRVLEGWKIIVLPAAVLALARMLMLDRFPITHALVDDWYNHAHYLTVFLLGALMARVPAMASWDSAYQMMMAWSAMVAACGFAYRHLDRDGPARRYLTEAVFPVYILHQTLIVVLAHAFKPLHRAPGLEAMLLVVLVTAGSFAGFEIVRRVPLLRPLFGLGPRASATHRAAAAVTPAASAGAKPA